MSWLLSAFLALALLFVVTEGQKWRYSVRDEASGYSQTLCPSYPYPVAEASTLLQALQPYLDEIGKNISSLLTTTPGGAVVSVVYRDTVIWTHGGGAINMSGKLVTAFWRQRRAEAYN